MEIIPHQKKTEAKEFIIWPKVKVLQGVPPLRSPKDTSGILYRQSKARTGIHVLRWFEDHAVRRDREEASGNMGMRIRPSPSWSCCSHSGSGGQVSNLQCCTALHLTVATIGKIKSYPAAGSERTLEEAGGGRARAGYSFSPLLPNLPDTKYEPDAGGNTGKCNFSVGFIMIFCC